jgi:cyclophilin family peptidyl-prolyl cis-trans isomerase
MKISRRIAIAAIAAAAALPFAAQGQDKTASCMALLKGKAPVKVQLATSMGNIVLQLDREKAPVSVENFLKYAESGHYNGTIFHRVMGNFMIQGGGFSKDGVQKKTQAPIANEARNGLKNEPYTVAMARTNLRDSATSQFFINLKDNEFLNYTGESQQGWGYAVFGKVVDGKHVVDKIRAVPVRPTGLSEAQPMEPVMLETATCLK